MSQMSENRNKLMEVVAKLPYVDMQEHTIFASRRNIEEAQEYVEMITDALPKEHQFYVSTAFMIVWNTLAKNYILFKKNPEPDIDEDVSAEIQMLKEK